MLELTGSLSIRLDNFQHPFQKGLFSEFTWNSYSTLGEILQPRKHCIVSVLDLPKSLKQGLTRHITILRREDQVRNYTHRYQFSVLFFSACLDHCLEQPKLLWDRAQLTHQFPHCSLSQGYKAMWKARGKSCQIDVTQMQTLAGTDEGHGPNIGSRVPFRRMTHTSENDYIFSATTIDNGNFWKLTLRYKPWASYTLFHLILRPIIKCYRTPVL